MNRVECISTWLASVAVLGVLIPTAARAAITSSGDVEPEDPTTWTNSTTAYIGYTDTANPGQVEVDGGSSLLSRYAYIGNNSGTSGTVTVTGTDSTWTNSSTLNVGRLAEGTLSIAGGGAVSNGTGYLGLNGTGTGEVTVDGDGSTWTNRGDLSVGRYGDGTLAITGGGAVSNTNGYVGYYASSTGEVTVDGADSAWTSSRDLHIGRGGDGTLNILSGGAVSVTGATYIASQDGSTGSIDFGTSGGTLTTASVYVSASQLSGTGTIDAQGIVSDADLVLDGSGGSPSVFSFNIASQGGGQVALNLDLSDTVGDLGAGYRESGSLVIQNGAAVSADGGYIGYRSGSTGTVTVNGAGTSWTNDGGLYVGDYGDGTLTVTGGAAVSNTSHSYIGCRPGSTGEVTVDGEGSTWTNSSRVYVGYYGAATLTITSGGTVEADEVAVGDDGVLEGDGLIRGAVRNGGLVSPGTSAGILPVEGDFAQLAGGRLDMELGGTDNNGSLAPEFDQLVVDGTASLAGELNISLIDAGGSLLAPGAGDEFALITATAGVSGQFDTVELPELASGLVWRRGGSAAQFLLLVATELDGDYNGDGVVDAADYTTWRDTLGQAVSVGQLADGDGSGTVDEADYAVWKAHYGETAGSGSLATNTIPEPATLVMFLLGIGVVFRRWLA